MMEIVIMIMIVLFIGCAIQGFKIINLEYEKAILAADVEFDIKMLKIDHEYEMGMLKLEQEAQYVRGSEEIR